VVLGNLPAYRGNGFQRQFQVAADGHCLLQDLPFGVYRMNLNAEGFAPLSEVVEVHSEVPVKLGITLGVAPDRHALFRWTANYSRGTQPTAGRALLDRIALLTKMSQSLVAGTGVLARDESNVATDLLATGKPIRRPNDLNVGQPGDGSHPRMRHQAQYVGPLIGFLLDCCC
jgi:hypothetical protein